MDVALQLYFMYLINTPHMRLSPVTKLSHVTPYVWLSVLLLVAIKLLYGLGNAAGGVSCHASCLALHECCTVSWQASSVSVSQQHLPSRSVLPAAMPRHA
jgi:hypothetical protein